ncbi:taud/tfda taurine catabolism dioxygenase [Grosmannia clavigera kw1407]|uniref:Taud/tfda taurine catabolism dioxygenase n=1 Tax=Grosmannia clavigera (strain kw1407 / UAMH 11150) TaxID=655863 RepID=F0XJU7_GROCL|nr:taud/tfda taurine catabolism dioxygenase [Grosmannia clavigera kw1407]EFX02219.1 taud/tfda taurine catabolism dioxygenase [Grosmannia clavigera kw1407]
MATQAVDLSGSLLETFEIAGSRLVHGKVFPLGIRPRSGTEFGSVEEAAAHFQQLADGQMFQQLLRDPDGAILFRGFPVDGAADLDRLVRSFGLPRPHVEVGLSGKRSTITPLVKTANEEPAHVRFYFHNEYGRSAYFPGALFFHAEKVPTEGGQTPLLSSLELYDRLVAELPAFIADLAAKGIIGRQYFPAKADVEAKTIGWNRRDSYGFDIVEGDSTATQRRKVEAVLRTRQQAEGEWQANGALYVLQRLPAIRRIAATGRPTFFNGLSGVYGRQRDRQALAPPHRGIDGGVHLPTTFGDGTAIPTADLERLLQIQEDIRFLVPWQAGDVALVDNYTVQHARTPWKGERSLLVSLWDGWETFVPY